MISPSPASLVLGWILNILPGGIALLRFRSWLRLLWPFRNWIWTELLHRLVCPLRLQLQIGLVVRLRIHRLARLRFQRVLPSIVLRKKCGLLRLVPLQF